MTFEESIRGYNSLLLKIDYRVWMYETCGVDVSEIKKQIEFVRSMLDTSCLPAIGGAYWRLKEMIKDVGITENSLQRKPLFSAYHKDGIYLFTIGLN